MDRLAIETAGDRRQYRVGERIEGRASWDVEKPPRSVEIRLFWYTQGKGDQDIAVADKVLVDGAGCQGQCSFAFDAPPGPYSFSGKLISLTWAIELVIEPGKHAERFDIVLSHTGEEIELYSRGGDPARPQGA